MVAVVKSPLPAISVGAPMQTTSPSMTAGKLQLILPSNFEAVLENNLPLVIEKLPATLFPMPKDNAFELAFT